MNEQSANKTPAPAQRLAIHAVQNGWTLDVDCNAPYSHGVQLPQFVYTRAEEVAGAVFGLIQTGAPGSPGIELRGGFQRWEDQAGNNWVLEKFLHEKANELMLMAAGRESDNMDWRARVGDLDTLVQELREKQKDLTARIGLVTAQRDHSRSTRSKTDAEVSTLQTIIDEHRKALTQSQALAEHRVKRIDVVIAEREELKRRLDEMNVGQKSSRERAESLLAQREHAIKLWREENELATKRLEYIRNLEADVAGLNKQLQEGPSRANAGLANENMNLIHDRDALIGQLQELKKKNAEIQSNAIRAYEMGVDSKRKEVDQLEDGLKTVSDQLAAVRKTHAAEIERWVHNRTQSCDYQQGHDDGKTTAQGVVNELKRIIRTLEQKLEGYRSQHGQVLALQAQAKRDEHRIVALNEIITKTEKDLKEAQELIVVVTQNLHKANMEVSTQRATISVLQDRLQVANKEVPPRVKAQLCEELDKLIITSENIGDIRRRYFITGDGIWNAIVRDETASRENNPRYHFEVGDVWKNNCGEVRCILGIDDRKNILYWHTHPTSGNGYKFVASPAVFTQLLASECSVERGGFSVNHYNGEPEQGFRVGDQWHKASGQIRIVTEVSDLCIVYDFRNSKDDDMPCLCRYRRTDLSWNEGGEMDNAKLVRKA